MTKGRLRWSANIYSVRIGPKLAESLYDLADHYHESQQAVIIRLLREGIKRRKER